MTHKLAAGYEVAVNRQDILAVREDIAALADWVGLNESPDIESELRSFIRRLDFALTPGPFAFIETTQGEA
jgi:hypothetical protein